jgi:photoactive yellow protein
MEILTFGSESLESALSELTEEQLNELAFGAIQLDTEGRVLQYNEAEGEITGRDPQAMLGKDFFVEVAPCTQNSEFCQRFYEALEQGSINVVFEYVFDYQMTPTKVKIHMYKRRQEASVWVLVKRL